ncbi:MAG: patatin-like phospholipase family protein [Alloprevotella sp.]|nr:patatin-like phospholipase family protein [Alloprevotella sp.]
MGKEVALVLSSGGARGYAHIGAIEALTERGYTITSVAGTSMGALVGGIYCAGRLPQFKEWVLTLGQRERLALYDPSVSRTHLLKGEKIINALLRLSPDQRIEQLPIPFRAIATDLIHSREIVFDRGSLYAAIRASIAVPTYYSPLRTRNMLLVDGGIVNPLPLNRVPRRDGDILVAVNVSAPADESLRQQRLRAQAQYRSALPAWIRRIMPAADSISTNYITLIQDSINTQIQRNTVLSLKLTPPQIMVSIPMNRFSGSDYDHAQKIIREGYVQMNEAIDKNKL